MNGGNVNDSSELPRRSSIVSIGGAAPQWILVEQPHLAYVRQVGIGASGTVHEIKNTHTDETFARKIIIPSVDINWKDVENEVRAIVALSKPEGHKNVVSVLDYGRLDHPELNSLYFIDMELCELDLDSYIYQKWASVDETKLPFFVVQRPARMIMWEIWDIIHDVLSGLCFIHGRNQVHRDIKPRNILYSVKSEVWKITDFGLTVEGTSKRDNHTLHARGTECYRAPELINPNPSFTNKVDIWAAGCVFYEIIFKEKIFKSDYTTLFEVAQWSTSETKLMLPETVATIQDDRMWSLLSSMIGSMFEAIPRKRPSAKELLEMLRPYEVQTPISSITIPSISSTSVISFVYSPVSVEEGQRFNKILAVAKRHFDDKAYSQVEEYLERELLNKVRGPLRSDDREWENLAEMLIDSNCKIGHLEKAEANIRKLLRDNHSEVSNGKSLEYKLAKPLVSTYVQQHILDKAIDVLKMIIDLGKEKRVLVFESQCALAEVYFRKKELAKAKDCCEEILRPENKISTELRNDSTLLMILICRTNNDHIDADLHRANLGDGYEDFIVVDHLCLMRPSDALRAISKKYLDDLIPENERTLWKKHCRRRSSDLLLSHQHLVLLQTFVNFGKPAQLQRLLMKWDYADKVDLMWEDDENSGSVLMEASGRGRHDIVRVLCDSRATVDLASQTGCTALHCAVQANQRSVIQVLLEFRPNVNLKSADGLTPLDLAKKCRNSTIVKMLESYIKESEKGIRVPLIRRLSKGLVKSQSST